MCVRTYVRFRSDVSTVEKKGKRKLARRRIQNFIPGFSLKKPVQIFKTLLPRFGKAVSLLFLFFPLSSSSFPSRWRALDAPVELVGKLIAPPPRFNSIIQAASCRCKFPRNVHLTPLLPSSTSSVALNPS